VQVPASGFGHFNDAMILQIHSHINYYYRDYLRGLLFVAPMDISRGLSPIFTKTFIEDTIDEKFYQEELFF